MEMIINAPELTQKEFDFLVATKNLEVYTQDQFNNSLLKGIGDTLQKSEQVDLSEEQQSEIDNELAFYKAEISSLNRWDVLGFDNIRKSITKTTFFTREQQIEWSIDEESGEILKGIEGIYLDTDLNRQLERVGEKYSCEL